jgi:hypothetical protein
MKKWLTISALFAIAFSCAGQKMDFFSETLTFRLQHDRLEVDGRYYFRNNTDKELRQMLFYPFPDVEKYGEISFISVTRADDTASVLINQTLTGARFGVKLAPREEAAYHIIYRQELITNEAKYIIVTTQKWGKPFETAGYRLEHPHNLDLTAISIPPDTTFRTPEKHIYLWTRQNFMPEEDFEFRFEKGN